MKKCNCDCACKKIKKEESKEEDKPQVIFLLGGPGSGSLLGFSEMMSRKGNCVCNSEGEAWMGTN